MFFKVRGYTDRTDRYAGLHDRTFRTDRTFWFAGPPTAPTGTLVCLTAPFGTRVSDRTGRYAGPDDRTFGFAGLMTM